MSYIIILYYYILREDSTCLLSVAQPHLMHWGRALVGWVYKAQTQAKSVLAERAAGHLSGQWATNPTLCFGRPCA